MSISTACFPPLSVINCARVNSSNYRRATSWRIEDIYNRVLDSLLKKARLVGPLIQYMTFLSPILHTEQIRNRIRVGCKLIQMRNHNTEVVATGLFVVNVPVLVIFSGLF